MALSVGWRTHAQLGLSGFCATLLWLVFPLNLDSPQQHQEIPRLADGRPNLQGNWDYSSAIPLERPLINRDDQLVVRPPVSLDWQSAPGSGSKSTESARRLTELSRSESKLEVNPSTNRDSLITTPDSGRIPALTQQGKRRIEELRESAMRNFGVEARSLTERCLTGSNSGPPMIPGASDNLVQIIQAGDNVVIYNRSMNSTRIIALGAIRRGRQNRQRGGESTGLWDGDMLVIESTNFVTPTAFAFSSEHLKLQEKFWLIDASTLGYEFTVSDAYTWSETWAASLEMRRTTSPIREHACHEENDALKHIMANSRRLELLEEIDKEDEDES